MNANDIVFTPADIAQLSETYLAKRKYAAETGGLDAGIPLYIDGLDNRNDDMGFLPVLPGEMVSIIARPGNGKTSFMMRWARERSRYIRARRALGEADAQRRVVVYCTWEQTVEELHAFHVSAEAADTGLSITKMARGKITEEQWSRIQKISMERVKDPLWFVGHSIERRSKRPIIDVSALASAMWEIENWQGEKDKTKIDCIFVDYLQRIPYGKAESKTVGISENLDRLKDAALALGCAVIVGVQAGRSVDEKKDPIPAMDEGQWTSNIEQSSDKVMSLVRPSVYVEQGGTFKGAAVQGYNQLYWLLLKQKLGQANISKWLDFDPRYNKLEAVQTKKIDLEK